MHLSSHGSLQFVLLLLARKHASKFFEELLAGKTAKLWWSEGSKRANVPGLTWLCLSLPLYLISFKMKNPGVWES